MRKIYIYNYQQAYFYMCKHGVEPIERPGTHPSTGNIYFVFDREATNKAYLEWININK